MARKLRYNDEEGGMAKAQLQKIEMYAAKLNEMIHPDDELEGWVQAKLAVVAAYMGDVKHYLDYELKEAFGEGGSVSMKQRYWEVEFTWDGAREEESREVNVMADSVGDAERKVKEKFGSYYKGLRILEIEEDKEMTWDEYADKKGKMADGGTPSENTFENVLLMNGFVSRRGSFGQKKFVLSIQQGTKAAKVYNAFIEDTPPMRSNPNFNYTKVTIEDQEGNEIISTSSVIDLANKVEDLKRNQKLEHGGSIDDKRERVIDYYLNNDVFDDPYTYDLSDEDLKDAKKSKSYKKIEDAIVKYHGLDDDENVEERFETLGLEDDDYGSSKMADGGLTQEMASGGMMGKMADGGVVEKAFVEITKPTDLKTKAVAEKIEDLVDMGYRSADILLKMAFVTTDTKPLEDQFRIIKNNIFYKKGREKFVKGGKMEDLFMKYEGSTYAEDMKEAQEYLGDEIWNNFTKDEKVEAMKYLKAQGLIGYYGELEDIETLSAMQYKKGGKAK